jgi:hypothetical protein
MKELLLLLIILKVIVQFIMKEEFLGNIELNEDG